MGGRLVYYMVSLRGVAVMAFDLVKGGGVSFSCSGGEEVGDFLEHLFVFRGFHFCRVEDGALGQVQADQAVTEDVEVWFFEVYSERFFERR